MGDEVTILCKFSHKLSKVVNVTGLMGSLNSPVNFNYYLQNFSYDAESYTATAYEDVTFDYTFKIADTLDAGQWQVAVTLFYQVGRYLYATTFYNQTITLVHPSGGYSLFGGLVTLLVLAAAAAFVAKDKIATAHFGAPPKHGAVTAEAAMAKAEATAEAAADDESWTAHLDTKPTTSRKPTKKASKSKKK